MNKPLIPALPGALAHWYADPLDPVAAQQLLVQARQHSQRACRQGHPALSAEIERLLAMAALGQAVDAELAFLATTNTSPAEHALLLLVRGQLLASRRVNGAIALLQQGFETAREQFLATDFFTVMRRHELLAELPLYAEPRPPVDLDTLLCEAAVIRRLRGPRRLRLRHDGADTTG